MTTLQLIDLLHTRIVFGASGKGDSGIGGNIGDENVQRLQEHIAELEAERTRLVAEQSDLNARIDNLTDESATQIASAEATLASLDAENSNKSSVIIQLMAEVDGYKSQLQTITAEIAKKDEEIAWRNENYAFNTGDNSVRASGKLLEIWQEIKGDTDNANAGPGEATRNHNYHITLAMLQRNHVLQNLLAHENAHDDGDQHLDFLQRRVGTQHRELMTILGYNSTVVDENLNKHMREMVNKENAYPFAFHTNNRDDDGNGNVNWYTISDETWQNNTEMKKIVLNNNQLLNQLRKAKVEYLQMQSRLLQEEIEKRKKESETSLALVLTNQKTLGDLQKTMLTLYNAEAVKFNLGELVEWNPNINDRLNAIMALKNALLNTYTVITPLSSNFLREVFLWMNKPKGTRDIEVLRKLAQEYQMAVNGELQRFQISIAGPKNTLAITNVSGTIAVPALDDPRETMLALTAAVKDIPANLDEGTSEEVERAVAELFAVVNQTTSLANPNPMLALPEPPLPPEAPLENKLAIIKANIQSTQNQIVALQQPQATSIIPAHQLDLLRRNLGRGGVPSDAIEAHISDFINYLENNISTYISDVVPKAIRNHQLQMLLGRELENKRDMTLALESATAMDETADQKENMQMLALEASNANTQLQAESQRARRAEEELRVLAEKNEKIQNEKNALDRELHQRISDLSQELAVLQTQHAGSRNDEQIQQLQDQIAHLESANALLEGSSADLNRKLTEMSVEKAKLEGELKAEAVSNAHLQEQIVRLDEDKNAALDTYEANLKNAEAAWFDEKVKLTEDMEFINNEKLELEAQIGQYEYAQDATVKLHVLEGMWDILISKLRNGEQWKHFFTNNFVGDQQASRDELRDMVRQAFETHAAIAAEEEKVARSKPGKAPKKISKRKERVTEYSRVDKNTRLYEEQIKRLQTVAETYHGQAEAAEVRVDILLNQVRGLVHKQNAADKLREQQKQTIEDLTKIIANHDDGSADVADLQDKLDQYQSDYYKTVGRLYDTNDERDKLADDYQKLSEDTDELHAQLGESEGRYRTLLGILNETVQDTETFRDEHYQALGELHEMRRALVEKDSAIADIQGMNADLQEEVENLQNAKNNYESTIKDMKKYIYHVQESYQNLEQVMEDFKNRSTITENTKKHIAALEHSNAEASGMMQAMLERFADAREQQRRYASAYGDAATAMDEMQEEIRRLARRNAILEQMRKRHEEASSSWEGTVADLQGQNANLEMIVSHLREENAQASQAPVTDANTNINFDENFMSSIMDDKQFAFNPAFTVVLTYLLNNNNKNPDRGPLEVRGEFEELFLDKELPAIQRAWNIMLTAHIPSDGSEGDPKERRLTYTNLIVYLKRRLEKLNEQQEAQRKLQQKAQSNNNKGNKPKRITYTKKGSKNNKQTKRRTSKPPFKGRPETTLEDELAMLEI